MDSLKNYILQQVYDHNLSKEDARNFLAELDAVKTIKDIAIIGMSGRFPLADNLEQYWDVLAEGRNCIREYPVNRWKNTENYIKRFYKANLIKDQLIDAEGNINMEYYHRAYLEHIDYFDADFFGISPREAMAMEPDHRIFLQLVYEAIEDAGYCLKTIYGKKAGIFAGLDNVKELKYKRIALSDPMVVTGTWPGILTGRVSYLFDFKGPSMVIDTACASGLVAVHQGCRAIRNSECEIAICGGLSSIVYSPYAFSDELVELDSIETKSGMIRTFDNSADGTTWGEGAGVVMLKSLEQALSDGDNILAVIKGSAINNDGASNGLTAPSVEAQEQLLKAAWHDAGVAPETIQYIEAHGTGTVLGDPIEIKAMTTAFQEYTNKKQFCGIGSVKPNIAHLVGASGMASLIKVVKMLEKKTMLPSINFSFPNQFIQFVNTPIYINDKKSAWPKEKAPRRAGVNSFGFSGTNCHVVLEEALTVPPTVAGQPSQKTVGFFTVSVHKLNVLHELLKRYLNFFQSHEVNMVTACYMSLCCRGHYQERIIMVVTSKDDLIEKIKYIMANNVNNLNQPEIYYGRHKVVADNKQHKESFEVTEGQRRQYSQMAQEILGAYKNSEVKNEVSEANSVNQAVVTELCRLYIKGADVEWSRLYDGSKISKIKFPIYPLELRSYWFEEEMPIETEMSESAKKVKLAPFIDELAAHTIYGDIYRTYIAVATHWVVADHVILGKNIIPGTTYIEMTCEIMRQYYLTNIRITHFVFHNPCVIDQDITKEIQAVVVNKGNYFEIIFMSRNQNNEWEKHAEGTVCHANTKPKQVSLNKLREEIKAQTGAAYINHENRESEIALGFRWDNESADTRGKNSILCKLELKEEIISDLAGTFIHIAMFDNAINAISQNVEMGLYLPYCYKEIIFYDKMPGFFYSHIKLNTEALSVSRDTITYDIDLIKADGTIFATVIDYCTKKVNPQAMKRIRAEHDYKDFYTTKWVQTEASVKKSDISSGKVLLIYTDEQYAQRMSVELSGYGLTVIAAMLGDCYQKRAESVYTIRPEEKDFTVLLKEITGGAVVADAQDVTDLDYIFYVMATDYPHEISENNELNNYLAIGIFGMVNLVKAYLKTQFFKKVRMVAIGMKAYQILEADAVLPEYASLMALMKAIPLEYENISCQYIDVDDSSDAANIIAEVLNGENCYPVAMRKNMRYYPELNRIELHNDYSETVGGTYLLTGGTGGLGLELAKYLADEKVNIILISRTHYPQRELWLQMLQQELDDKTAHILQALLEIEKRGARVELYAADISDEQAVKEMTDYLAGKYQTLSGIIHCAGNAGDGMIINRSLDRMRQVISPKVNGTFLLDKYTRKMRPGYMLLFSTMLTVFGDVGQADYMCANAYMDAYADWRNQQGLKTRVINWPAWKETGMAVAYGAVSMESIVEPIRTQRALQIISLLLCSKETRFLPGRLNHQKIKGTKDKYQIAFSAEINSQINNAKIHTDEHHKKSTDRVYEYKSEYTETENKLCEIWTDVLKTEHFDVYDNFSDLGGDSFLAIQLYKQINLIYVNVIEVSDIFTYPSISKMAEYIERKTGKNVGAERSDAEKKSDQNINNIIAQIIDGTTTVDDAIGALTYR